MNQNGKIHQVDVDSIKLAPFNPLWRTDHHSISGLKESIERVGILQPLMVTPEMELVDGHRRLECAKMLGMKNVPIVIRDGSRADLFQEANGYTRNLTKADDLHIYLTGGNASKRAKTSIELIDRVFGREFLEFVAENRKSPAGITQLTTMVLTYLDKNDPVWTSGGNDFALKFAWWVLKNKQTFRVRAAIVNHMSRHIIISCIENDTALP